MTEQQKMIIMRDEKRIYTESYISDMDRRTIVFVHGGPGQGCWDFRYVARELSQFFNVIMFDERGVLRSDSIEDNFSSDMLVDDIEDIRAHFGIDKIVLCGHSYGAQLVIRYALRYPQHLDVLIYLCPSFDFRSSIRSVYQACLKKIFNDTDAAEVIRRCLHQDRLSLYLESITSIPQDVWNGAYHISQTPEAVAIVNSTDDIPEEYWQKGQKHQQCVFGESEIETDYSVYLREINVPSLLVTGELDPVCTAQQKEIFIVHPHNKHIEIPNAGHMVYSDDHADEMVTIMSQYLQCKTD